MYISESWRSKLVEILVISVYILLMLYLLPLSFAILLSYYLYPLVLFIHTRLKIPYFLAIIFILIITSLLVFQFAHFLIDSFVLFIPMLYEYILEFPFPAVLDNFMDQISTSINNFYEQSFNTFVNAFISSIGQMMNLFLFYFAIVFSLIESRKNKLWFFNMILKKYRTKWTRYFNQIAPYIKYKIIVEFILFTITFILLIAFFVGFNFPHSIHLAFVVALIDLLPMFGLALFFIPLAIIYFIQKQYLLLIITVLFYIFLITTRQLVDSKLWANSLQIEMAHSFFITAASLLLFNFYGLLIAPILIMLFSKIKRTNYF